MLSPTRSYQHSLFSHLSKEDQEHIDAMRPHFDALNEKFGPQQIYKLLTSNRLSCSSSGTNSSTPSIQRTPSVLSSYSSTDLSFRSSFTSITSASTSNSAHSDWPVTTGNQSESTRYGPDTHDGSTRTRSIDMNSHLCSPDATRAMSISSEAGQLLLFCMYPGHERSFKRKSDWKDHMDRYHKPGPVAWDCQLLGCTRRFETELLFKQHHASDHHCRRSCTHSNQSKKPAHRKLAFACGFEGCCSLLTTWDNWRDHVRDHLMSGTEISSWNYTTEFRNLLRRREISTLWDTYVKQQLGAAEGYQNVFDWDPSTTSEFKKHLEFSVLRHGLDDLIDQIFLATIRVQSQTEFQSPLTSLPSVDSFQSPLNVTDLYAPLVDSNAVQSLSYSELNDDNSFTSSAYNVTYDPNNHQYKYQQVALDHIIPTGLSHTPGLEPVLSNSVWNLGHAMNQYPSSAYSVPLGTRNRTAPDRLPDFWYPMVPPNVPDDPVAAYGLPPDATNSHALSATMDSQHSRTKSSGTNSIAKKISGYFSSGRKSNHSRSDSDNSDQRMGGMQAYY